MTSTRPFMRALCGLAQAQAELGQVDKAIGNYQELLRLNPGDNQGVRYILLPLLLTQGRNEEAETLLADFEDDVMAAWQYSRALMTFRKKGDTPAARRQFKEAVAANRHVPKYLLGDAEIDGEPDQYAIGSNEEGIICANECGVAWQTVPGALDWLRAQVAKPSPRRGKPRGPKRK